MQHWVVSCSLIQTKRAKRFDGGEEGFGHEPSARLNDQECASFNSQCLVIIGTVHCPSLCLVPSEAKLRKR